MKKLIPALLVATITTGIASAAYAAEEKTTDATMAKTTTTMQTEAKDDDNDTMMPNATGMGMMGYQNMSASTQAYVQANMQMHHDMMINYTGNADIDFMRGMKPHHQGAIAMAEIALKYGKDPKVRMMAENIIKAQKAEIMMMDKWLAEHDKTKK